MWLSISLLFSVVGIGGAQTISSCSDIKNYFFFSTRAEDPNPLVRKGDLKEVVTILKSEEANPNTECSDVLFERGFAEYAQLLDEYGGTLEEPRSVRAWKIAAANGYQDYVDWFSDLGADRQNILIATIKKTSTTASTFKRTQTDWLRLRVGGILCRLAACLVVAQQQNHMFDIYEVTCQTHAEFFPDQATREWYKWLLQQPTFAPMIMSEADIEKNISTFPNSLGHWQAFDSCLSRYIQLNPSVSEAWQPSLKRINKWLSQANVSAELP